MRSSRGRKVWTHNKSCWLGEQHRDGLLSSALWTIYAYYLHTSVSSRYSGKGSVYIRVLGIWGGAACVQQCQISRGPLRIQGGKCPTAPPYKPCILYMLCTMCFLLLVWLGGLASTHPQCSLVFMLYRGERVAVSVPDSSEVTAPPYGRQHRRPTWSSSQGPEIPCSLWGMWTYLVSRSEPTKSFQQADFSKQHCHTYHNLLHEFQLYVRWPPMLSILTIM